MSIRIVNGVKFYPVNDFIKFNLESLLTKVLNDRDDAYCSRDMEKFDELCKVQEEIENLHGKALSGWMCGKDYGRAKEMAIYREILRDESCARYR